VVLNKDLILLDQASYNFLIPLADNGPAPARIAFVELILNDQYNQFPVKRIAIDCLEQLASEENPDALARLGYCYRKGIGLPRNPFIGLTFSLRAACLGNPEARIQMERFAYGKDKTLKRYLAQLSKRNIYVAAQGSEVAQLTSGVVYANGWGINKRIDKAKEWLTLSMDQGNARAGYELSQILLQGKATPVEAELGLEYLETAATNGLAEAQRELATRLFEGIIIPRDFPKALEWAQLAVRQGDVKATVLLESEIRKSSDPGFNWENAVSDLQWSADRGNPEAMRVLGDLHREGKIVSKDFALSESWYQRASFHSHPGATYSLATMLINGVGTEPNLQKGLTLLNKAASLGETRAQSVLGEKLLTGNGIEKDTPHALKYLKMAFDKGDPQAAWSLGQYYFDAAIGKGISQKCLRYLTVAHNAGNAEATCAIGSFYFLNHKVEKDIDLAEKYFKTALNMGVIKANYHLGMLYRYKRRKVPVDTIISHFEICADQGDLHSMAELGKIYVEDNTGRQDVKKGFDLLTRSASQDNMIAHYVLGIHYERGTFGEKDIEKAEYHYRRAVDLGVYPAKKDLKRLKIDR
jgi:TPR repeat protein